MIHLGEQVKLVELKTLQVIIKSNGLHTYLEETIKSTQHVFYANTSLSSQVLCRKHCISMSLGKYKAKLDFCEIKFGHKNTPTPLTLLSRHNYAIFSKYFELASCTKCKGLV